MASGVEMMLKALGIDPQEIQAAMTQTIGKLQAGIKGLDDRLSAIDQRQERIEKRLERLEEHFGISSVEIVPELRRISRQ